LVFQLSTPSIREAFRQVDVIVVLLGAGSPNTINRVGAFEKLRRH
jgi:hypothetical protein